MQIFETPKKVEISILQTKLNETQAKYIKKVKEINSKNYSDLINFLKGRQKDVNIFSEKISMQQFAKIQEFMEGLLISMN